MRTTELRLKVCMPDLPDSADYAAQAEEFDARAKQFEEAAKIARGLANHLRREAEKLEAKE